MGEKEVADHKLGPGEGGGSLDHQIPGPLRPFWSFLYKVKSLD